MSDQVGVTENLTSTDPAQSVAPLGTMILLTDRLHTSNQFNGADVGLAGEYHWNSWTLSGTVRIALGSTYERADVNGSTTINVPGFAPVASPGGLLALSSNSGIHSRDVFAVVPEIRVRLAYEVGPHLRSFRRLQLPLLEPRRPGRRPDRPGGEPRLAASPRARGIATAPGVPVPGDQPLGAGNRPGAGIPLLSRGRGVGRQSPTGGLPSRLPPLHLVHTRCLVLDVFAKLL